MTQEYRHLGSNYRLVERIGQGAMGEVWRGLDAADQPVAVKLLLPHLANDPAMVQRFVGERSVLTGVKHRNVVQVFDLVAEGKSLGIVMEYVPGPDLREVLHTQRTLAPALVAHVGQAVAQGLGAIHRRQVFHRDVKPENVLLAGGAGLASVPKLTDFGISRLSPTGAAQTATMVVGTPYYMAPELADGSLPTARSDLYALGVLLYELCCGVTPFQGRPALGVLQAHATLLPGRPDGIPDELWEIIARLLAKDPAARPGSDAEVVGLLAPLVTDLAELPAAPALTEPPVAVAVQHTGTTVLPAAAAAAGLGATAAVAAGAPPVVGPTPHTDTVLTPPGWNPASSGVPLGSGAPVATGAPLAQPTPLPFGPQAGYQTGFPNQAGYQTGFPPGPGSSGVGWVGSGPGASPAPAPRRRTGGLVALALLPLLALVAGGVWYVSSDRNQPAAVPAPVPTSSAPTATSPDQPASTSAPTQTQTVQVTQVVQPAQTVTVQQTTTQQAPQEGLAEAPVGKWVLVLESLEQGKYSYADASAKAASLSTSGATVHVLDSTDTPGLRSGYWALAVLPFDSRGEATAMCPQMGRETGDKCYPRRVG
ncbi:MULTISPECIES: serine/threonine-protein kinase [unclassified Luteococcus]|uniref:serine/threonine-protein kinase n=1 Tax=unclassified Luteococcus TaxID=2639923 RepID=UPI00313CACA1